MEPLKNLGLDPQNATKLTMKLHAHSVQNACKLVSVRSALEKSICKLSLPRSGMGYC